MISCGKKIKQSYYNFAIFNVPFSYLTFLNNRWIQQFLKTQLKMELSKVNTLSIPHLIYLWPTCHVQYLRKFQAEPISTFLAYILHHKKSSPQFLICAHCNKISISISWKCYFLGNMIWMANLKRSSPTPILMEL